MNITRTLKSSLAAAALLAAATVAKADTTYIWNRTSSSANSNWNNVGNWLNEDGTPATSYPNGTDAIVVFREGTVTAGANLQNGNVSASLKELRFEGDGGKWAGVYSNVSETDNLLSRLMSYQGSLKFSGGGGISFTDIPARSIQPIYCLFWGTFLCCQGNGHVVFDIPENIEVVFDRADVRHADSGDVSLLKCGEGTVCLGNGTGNMEVPVMIERGMARLAFASASHNIAVPLTIAGDEVTIVIDAMNDKRVESAGGLGFGTGYLVETAAVTGGKHSIVSQYGSVLGFYGATAASQTFSGRLAGNLVFEFKPTSSACEFVFRKGVSTTTGAMTIATGTVRVTDGASFPNVGSVSVNGGTVMIEEDGAAAFPSASFTLSNGGRIGASAGLSVCVKAVSGVANGIYKRVGSSLSEGTEASWVAGDGLVVVGSPVEAAREEVTWAGKGANYYPSTSANWSSAPQSLTDGSAFVKVDSGATASSGYASFVADSDVWVNGFSVSKVNFGIGAVANRKLWIGSGGITNPANGEVVVGFGSAPGTVVLSADQTWNSGNSGNLRVHGNVKTYGGAKLTVRGSDSGNNVLRLASATPDWKNAVLATNMVVKFEAANALGSSKVAPVTIFHKGVDNSPTFANGVEVNRPLVLADCSSASTKQTKLSIPSNGTVAFNAPVVSSNKTDFVIVSGAGSRVVFNDLFMSRNSVYVSGSGTIVFNGPFHTCYCFYPNGFTGTIELHSTGNRFNGLLGDYWTAGTIKTMVPYAFTAQNPRRVTASSDTTNNPIDADTRSLLYLKQNATLDLCGNDQIFGELHTAGGGVITSATPATLYMDFTASVVTEYINANSKAGYKSRVEKAIYTGAVNYSKWGQLPRWFMADSTSTGIVEVAEGTITFCSGSGTVNLTPESGTAYNYPDALARGSWRNASAVVIKGGKMVFEHSEAVGRHTDVRFEKMNNAYGKLRLESGVRQQVGYLYIDGVKQASGRYGSTSSSATHQDDTLFEGEGVIEVTGDSPFMMIFR